jgi:lipoprotein NlpI
MQERTLDCNDYYAKATQINPYLPWLWNRWGTMLLNAKQFSDAEKKFRRALELDPSLKQAADGLERAINHVSAKR